MKKPVVLIVDDEKNSREGLARALQRNYEVLLADSGQRALDILAVESVDVMLSDVRMPGVDGLTLLQRAIARPNAPVCIMLTAYGSIELAVEAMRRGAYDFMTKPINLDRLDMVLKRALDARALETENRALREQLDTRFGLEEIIGQSPAIQEVFDTIRQVAPSRATVLIQGESGTGKELVARALHRLSPRNKGPFVAVHCAALSTTLLESELFGHEKGAFTGATERRKGRFELADGGTLFLDEIGEIDAALQVKILRVLEERRFERVGGTETIDVDVRLVVATNRDLKQMVAEGKFREDLFFRLDVVTLQLPPLRERVGDLPLLAQHYISVLARENGKKLDGITPEALHALSAYDWPGNVRELRNMIERMVVLSRGDRLTLRDVPPHLRSDGSAAPLPGGALSLEANEKQMIVRALKANDGNVTRAAAELGISRRTLHRKLNDYDLREKKEPDAKD
ncbi:MAG: sigma-54 dependent transcriptional regulator [Kiritimatiellae bacterium]|nr:sigma-54 dependent transcriptional regulator [Kiritimatiellia bacterium]